MIFLFLLLVFIFIILDVGILGMDVERGGSIQVDSPLVTEGSIQDASEDSLAHFRVSRKKPFQPDPKYWLERIDREFFKIKGQHIGILGITGSGKTQTIFYLTDGLHKSVPEEVLVVLDVGKSHECLTFGLFMPLHFIIPEGCDVDIKLKEGVNIDITKGYIVTPAQVWDEIKTDRINIVCFEAFIEHEATYTKYVGFLFNSLIKRAKRYMLPPRLTVICDEFQNIAPSKNNAIDIKHYLNGAKVQKNMDRIRSYGIRIMAAFQGWTMVRYGCRKSFLVMAVKQGGIFLSGDQPRLRNFNRSFERLEVPEAFFVFRNKDFTPKMRLPLYPEELGQVRYHGVWGKELDDGEGKKKQ